MTPDQIREVEREAFARASRWCAAEARKLSEDEAAYAALPLPRDHIDAYRHGKITALEEAGDHFDTLARLP